MAVIEEIKQIILNNGTSWRGLEQVAEDSAQEIAQYIAKENKKARQKAIASYKKVNKLLENKTNEE